MTQPMRSAIDLACALAGEHCRTHDRAALCPHGCELGAAACSCEGLTDHDLRDLSRVAGQSTAKNEPTNPRTARRPRAHGEHDDALQRQGHDDRERHDPGAAASAPR